MRHFRLSVSCFMFIMGVMGGTVLWAEDLDPLSETQKDLTQPERREKVIQQSPAQVQWMHKQVQGLAGNQANTEEIYGLSADIFATLEQQSGGDPKKMMELLEKAKTDPKGFAERFTPEQKAKLKEISRKIPDRSPVLQRAP